MTAPLTEQIDAHPTKSFFVDMLVRDIPLEQAILDLVDNSIDGAKRITLDSSPFENLYIKIVFGLQTFSIEDNCGGFDSDAARDYAFRFGRPKGAATTPNSIGQFGVGMKRALFKFGRHFRVASATKTDVWAVEIDVNHWENEPDWHFPWSSPAPTDGPSNENPGTEIIASSLRKEVAARFATLSFQNTIIGLIRSKHRQFISRGIQITVNDQPIHATGLNLLVSGDLKPGVELIEFKDHGEADVRVKIVVGVGPSNPKDAGWYVACNGRVILEADRRDVTGWGLVEESSNKIVIPSFHNQFARFRGVVYIDSVDSARVPWNTTKTDVDQDNSIWRSTFERMLEMTRPVIDFLNELDADVDEFSSDDSPMLDLVRRSPTTSADDLTVSSAFVAPTRGSVHRMVKTVKIQFSRPLPEVELLQERLGVGSAKAVGEFCFDDTLARQS